MSLKNNNYRADIDGLRSVAIIAVIIFHAFPTILPGGFVGVDVFFVISGFLISSIIFKEYAENKFSLIQFYIRRIRRIFPVLSVVLIVFIFIGWLCFLPDELMLLGKHISYSVIFIFNFCILQENGYFDINSELKPLLHLWSLSIEEQFYLFWPILIVIMLKRKFTISLCLISFILISFAANIYMTNKSIDFAFFVPHTRFWELISGSFLAWIKHKKLNNNFLEKRINNSLYFIKEKLIIYRALPDQIGSYPQEVK